MGDERVYLEDASSGLRLLELQRQSPSGHMLRLYRFEVADGRKLPRELVPEDPADGMRFEAAFDDVVDWLKSHPA